MNYWQPRAHTLRRIEAFIGPKRISSVAPDGRAHIIVTFDPDGLIIQIHLKAYNIPSGSLVPSGIHDRIYEEIDGYIRAIENVFGSIFYINLPPSSSKGVWPLEGFASHLSAVGQVNYRD